MVVLLLVAVGLAVLALVVWAGTRMVAHPDPAAGSVGGAFGAGLAVLDPGKARAEEDLESHQRLADVLPSPDEDDRPVWTVDLHRNRVRIPRQR